jgi:hypothetical protein
MNLFADAIGLIYFGAIFAVIHEALTCIELMVTWVD